MRAPATATPSDSRDLARGGLLSFIGAATSAVCGFLLTIVLARALGDSGTGIVLQAIAIFSIGMSFARAGMDSAAVWLLPRLSAAGGSQVRGAVVYMLVTSAASGIVCAGLIAVGARMLFGGDENGRRVAETAGAIAWFLPAAAVVLVAVAATRGLGGVWPYVAISGIGVPAARLATVTVAAAISGSLAAVAVGWAAPVPVALVIGLGVIAVQVRRWERAAGRGGGWWPERNVRGPLARYAVPRTISAGLEQAILWLDVLIVGFLAGSAAAGVYGGASRFVAAGLIVDTAIRMVVSPRFSALLHAGRLADLEGLYRTAARWLVLFSTPVSLTLAVFAPVVLGWLGPGFEEGATALAILCAGTVITFTAGNIHSVLLMSGRSGWAAFNKAVVLLVNVIGNVILIPILGIDGAAISWAASMLIDAVLATIEVRRFVGIRVDLVAVGYALLGAVATVGIPGVVIRSVWGANLASLLTALAFGGILFGVWCTLDRRRLQLQDLAVFVRRAPSASAPEMSPEQG